MIDPMQKIIQRKTGAEISQSCVQLLVRYIACRIIPRTLGNSRYSGKLPVQEQVDDKKRTGLLSTSKLKRIPALPAVVIFPHF